VTNGDPSRTLYVSKSRSSVGTVGSASSTGFSGLLDGSMTTAASSIIGQNNILETTYLTQAAVSPTSTSSIDNQNLFMNATTQGTAYGVFGGGVQQMGAAGSFGDFGPVSNAEFALDLYRIVAKTGLGGQVEGPLRTGTYEGSLLLDNSGNVSFVTSPVPEPSTYPCSASVLWLCISSTAVATNKPLKRKSTLFSISTINKKQI